MLKQQIDCTSGPAMLTVWVEAGRVRAGNTVTFKETGRRRWKVVHVWTTLLENTNRGWGLQLPKGQRTEA